jgi:hypothetical protein
MSDKNTRASLNFFQGADSPTLMLLIFEDADLSGLKDKGRLGAGLKRT